MATAATWTFEAVAGPFTFTEGPVWDGSGVRFTDIPTSRILRYDARSGETTVFAAETNETNGLALDGEGRLIACEGGAGRVVRYEADGTRAVLASEFEGEPFISPNDVVVDSRGRVWFTDPRYGDRATMRRDHDSVYRLDPAPNGEFTVSRVTFDTTRPNGLAFAPDEQTLYVAESPPAPEGIRQLRAYPVAPDGSLGAMRVLHDFGPHRGIDGMRVDSEGTIVAAAGWTEGGPGPRVAVFSPDGDLLAEHPTPAEPTNCCFGDDDRRTLYLTAKDGHLYRARTDRHGQRLAPRIDSGDAGER